MGWLGMPSGWNQVSAPKKTPSQGNVHGTKGLYGGEQKDSPTNFFSGGSNGGSRSSYSPPPFVNPYLGLKSKFESMQNPFGIDYENRIINAQRGDVQTQFSDAGDNIREALARRGLTQGGVSGIEQEMVRRNEADRAGTLTRLNSHARLTAADKAASWDKERAGAIDLINQVKAAGDLQYGVRAQDIYDRMQTRPVEIEGMQIANDNARLTGQSIQQGMDHADALLPEQLRSQRLSNDQVQQSISQAAQLFPDRLEQTQIATSLAQLDLNQRESFAKWYAENSWWVTPAEIGAKLVSIAGPAIAHFLPTSATPAAGAAGGAGVAGPVTGAMGGPVAGAGASQAGMAASGAGNVFATGALLAGLGQGSTTTTTLDDLRRGSVKSPYAGSYLGQNNVFNPYYYG